MPKFEKPKLTTDQLREIMEITEKEEEEHTIIRAQTPENKEIVFEMEKIKQHWLDAYEQNKLQELAKELEPIAIRLSEQQIKEIQELARKEGFDYFILLPSIETQEKHLTQIKKQTEKPIKGLKGKNQYSDQGTYLSDTVKPNFPDNIQTNNRPENKAYLLFLKDTAQVDAETVNKPAEQLRKEFKKKNETGLTIAEYLLFQRDYTQRHINEKKAHPDDYGGPGKATRLLDSELDAKSSLPGQVLYAYWFPGFRQVEVRSYPASYSGSHSGARSSAIFEIG
jgi:predicted DNA binding CopG/RHH family protein